MFRRKQKSFCSVTKIPFPEKRKIELFTEKFGFVRKAVIRVKNN